jgi:TRAP-type C4-dicarboxylate transport system substrate-binding protein
VQFAKRVAARSGGTLRVEILQSYPSAEPRNEARLARALRSGKVPFGFLNARAWSVAGVPEFAALQAPFVLGDYDTARRAASGPAGAVLKAALERAGVVALGLSPQAPRRVLAVKPLVRPADYDRLRIRIYDAATAAADLRALGAQPVRGIDADGVEDALGRHRLDGAETGPGGAVSFGFWRGAHHITDYALFGAFDTIVASRSAWARLTPSEQAALRAAGEDTLGFGATLAERDAASLEELCHAGVRVSSTEAPQLSALAAATEPVRAALRQGSATAELMRLLEATEGAGPRVLPTPAGCHATGARRAGKPDDPAAIPNGVYVTRTTREDKGVGYLGPADAYTWTTRLHDGNWVRTVSPRFPGMKSDVDGAGTYEVHGNEVTFHYTKPMVDASPPETLSWSYYDGQLTLKVVDVADDGARGIYSVRPWRKVR